MRTLICCLLCLFLIGTAQAGTSVYIDADQLSPEQAKQLQEIRKAIETKRPIPSVEEMSKYAQLGEAIAKAIGATCKELRVEVNEFVKTPVGWWTMFLIVWKIVGHGLLKGVIATIAWITTIVISLVMWKKYFSMLTVTDKRTLKDGTVEETVRRVPSYSFNSNDGKAVLGVFTVAIPVVMTVLWVILI